MVKKIIKRIMMVIVISMMVIADSQTVKAGTVLSETQVKRYLDEISKYQMSVNSNPGCGSTGGEWTVMALARYGSINRTYIEKYKSNLKQTLDNCGGVLSKKKYTEYSRVVLALTAIGENPEDFEGYNLLTPLSDYKKVAVQGVNGIVYALLAMDSGNYKVKAKDSEGKTVREKILDSILKNQLTDGGWSSMGESAEADITAMVIQALIPYMKDEKINNVVERAFDALSGMQNENGGFSTMNVENCEAVAQVLTAMSEAGISVEDSRFVKNEKTVIDVLLEYYKNGAFSHLKNGEKNAMATDQAMYALVSYERKITGRNNLYDMSDGLVLLSEEETTEIYTDAGVSKENRENITKDPENSTDESVHYVANRKDTLSKDITNKSNKNKKTNSKSTDKSMEIIADVQSNSETGNVSIKEEVTGVAESVNGKHIEKKRETKQNSLGEKEGSEVTELKEEEFSSQKKATRDEPTDSAYNKENSIMGVLIFLGVSGILIYKRKNILEMIGKINEKKN